jgi:hypothetical protein
MMVRVTSRIHTDLLPEDSNVIQTRVAIYQLKKSTNSCAESPRSGPCLNGSPSTFSYFVNFNIHNLSRKLGIWLGFRQPTVCRIFCCHPSNFNIYTGTERGSARLTRNSRSSEMVGDLRLILLPLTSRRLRIASWSSSTVPTICVSSILPRT